MISKIVLHKGEYAYIRFKALIWHSNCLIQHQTVHQSCVKLLDQIYTSVYENIPLVVSLKGVVDLGDRTLENFFSTSVQENKRPIIFIHNDSFSDNIVESILRLEKSKRPKYESDSEDKDIIKLNCSSKEDSLIKNLKDKINNTELEFLRESIKNCSKKVNQRLLSTVVSANIEFDASKIISEPHIFIWVCLFMADKIQDFLKENAKSGSDYNSSNIRLLAVSLRSSPFVSAVSYLIDKGYDLIDHLGPKHKLLDLELLENFKKGVKYIYIGDFTVGGTEIKIAQAYSELLGCELNYAVVLSSLLDPDVFKEIFTLIPLTMINDIIPDAEYKLTELKQ